MKKVTKYTLFDNYDTTALEEDARAYLAEEHPDEEVTDEEVYNYVFKELSFEYDDVFAGICNALEDEKVIMFGSCGLWDGSHDGGEIGDFEELYYRAIKDCDYINITEENGHLFLTCSHHDGTNYFEFRVLTDRGAKYAENWNYTYTKKYDYSEQTMHNHIINCSFLSRLPRVYSKIYG